MIMKCRVLLHVVMLLSFSLAARTLIQVQTKKTTKFFGEELSTRRLERSSDVSCNQSPIQVNVTLKGGIEAGYFRKLAQHVAMQLCIELCCEEKGCDVAFMSGKNCYGVQCFSEELCRALPAKKDVSEPVMISHVTFKGERVPSIDGLSHNEPKCKPTAIKNGVTLHGGLKAGNFTHIGVVNNSKKCTKLCCLSKTCDVAFIIGNVCFLVLCFSTEHCKPVKSLSKDYKPSLVYVSRTYRQPNESANSLQVMEMADNNQLVCKNSQVFHNTTLKGGYKAGNYTNFGKVSNMTACVRLCCGNRDCDAALMLENNCFAVACRDSENCLPVHAKSSSSLAALNPRISYITSRSEELSLKDQTAPDGTCHAGIISYDVSLKGGANAGNFTPHGKVGGMAICIYKCCQIEGCGVAMMLKDTCFTVVCTNDELCDKKQTPTSSDFNPRIAYVFRDKSNTTSTRKFHKIPDSNNLINKNKDMLVEQLYAINKSPTTSLSSLSRSTTVVTKFIDKQLNNIKSNTTLNSTISQASLNDTQNSNKELNIFLSESTIQNISTTVTPPLSERNVSEYQTECNTSSCISNKTEVIPPGNTTNLQTTIYNLKSTLSSVDGDPGCTSSQVLRNVTLRNGLRSGKFKDRGEMEDIKQCVKLCCLLDRCDVAFMLQKTCFSVDCHNRMSCEAVPAKSSIYTPTICYIYVKSAPNVT